jgi:hypothetical protein
MLIELYAHAPSLSPGGRRHHLHYARGTLRAYLILPRPLAKVLDPVRERS